MLVESQHYLLRLLGESGASGLTHLSVRYKELSDLQILEKVQRRAIN